MKAPLTVGFDVTWMNVENRAGGVFQYAHRIISALAEYTDCNVVAIIGPMGKGIFDHLSGHGNFRAVFLDYSQLFAEVLKAEQIDVIHSPIQRVINCTPSVPMVHTLHDLQHLHCPEFFTEEEIEFRNAYYRKSAEFCERVIVSFDHVKNDLVELWGVPGEKIDVCPPGIEKPKPVDQSRFPEIKNKYSLPGKYFFYPANTWPHKNHMGLMKALKLVHEKYGEKASLVCTGYQYDDYFSELKAAIDELGLQGHVHFTGYIPEDDVLLLLNNAALAVVPTLYEAGSFALMEAMAYGVPVICSNVTSLPETIGDGRFVFDPNNPEEMAGKINIMLRDEKLREENRANSASKVKEKGWDSAIRRFVDSYQRGVKGFAGKKDGEYYKDKLQNYEFFTNDLVLRQGARLNRLRSRIEKQIESLNTLREEHNRRLSQINELREESSRQLLRIKEQDERLLSLNRERDEQLLRTQEQSRQLQQKSMQLRQILNSKSWKITRPLREVKKLLVAPKKKAISRSNRANPKIYVVLPTHNRISTLSKFIDCLREQTYRNYHLILVNDGCTDGSVEYVRKNIENLTVLNGNGSLWWAGSLTRAYRHLSRVNAEEDDLVYINNDDSTFKPDYFEKVVNDPALDPNTLVVSPGQDIGSDFIERGFAIDWPTLNFFKLKEGERPDAITTRGLYMHYGTYKSLGPLHPILLPHYISDLEYTIRAKRRGLRLAVSSSSVLCVDRSSTGAHEDNSTSLREFLYNHLVSKKTAYSTFYWGNFVLLAAPWKYKLKAFKTVYARFFSRLKNFYRNRRRVSERP
jgi:glycosyltransferase involved in cell wall biosynthesis/GT2 family glycosyltransferase